MEPGCWRSISSASRTPCPSDWRAKNPSFEIRPADLSAYGGRRDGKVMGGVAQELEIPSARVLFEWRSVDHVALHESYSRVGNAWDYFHMNSIDVDADGHLLISARNTWAVYKVHRRTGEVLWRLGGKKSDFALGRGVRFAWQHDARSHDGGRVMSIFDNGSGPMVEPQSRGLMLALDVRHRRATLIRQYTHRPPLSARAMGNVQLLPDGNVVVGWGTTPGLITEYSADGAVLFDAALPHGGENYRAFRFPWVGRPVEPPAAALVRGPEGLQLYASWNGATEVTAWQLETGSAPDAVSAAGRVPKDGFETRISLPASARYAAATALDAAGRPLGRSAPVHVG